MDLNAVNIFISVAETGSLSAASRKLDLPVSTISRRIQALEKQLEARLLERSTRRMRLTIAGEDLYDSCASAIMSLKDAEANLSCSRDLPSGLVRVVIPQGYSKHLFLPLVRRFRRHYPDIAVSVSNHYDGNELISGTADIVFSTEHQEDHRTTSVTLLNYAHQLVASPEYIGQASEPKLPEDLLHYDCLTLKNGGKSLAWQFDNRDGKNWSKISPQEEIVFSCYSLIREAAVAGMGIAVLPTLMAGPLIQDGSLTPLLDDWRLGKGSLSAMIPAHQQLPRAARVFMDYTEEYLSSVINWPLV
ncbi:hypothetical protein EOPP23_06580 [Endozoicomonas sp. OPT23]|uniref:LysR family transcriptional regulator n=1 Tax=Endozoicomonas sp. OPT23 TaxID=2072845 RepID=UPI00129AD233|nr:LysR family transcriptional regulator [Endozoicomonas sp. OPT23]MRI32652.1 hypothetical protein [Endozoicomonas sp. OPT23]